MDNPAVISIIGSTYEVNGKLEINIIPTDEFGSFDIPDEMIPD